MDRESNLFSESVSVLLIEDSKAQGLYFKECLEEVRQGALNVTWVMDCASAVEVLGRQVFDSILLDLNLPDSMGSDTFYTIYPKARDTPVIILSVVEDDKTVLRLLQEGARDYFIKKGVNPRALFRTIQYSIIQANSEKEVQARKRQMEEELKKAYAELDIKVNERTRELEEANKSLSQEINQRKVAEKELIESRTRYQIVADFNYHWETWIGPSGKYRYVSPSCERISGYPPEKFIENPHLIVDIAHPDDREIVHDHFIGRCILMSPMHPIDFRIIHKDGHTVWINHACRSVHDVNNKFIGRRGSNLDITDRVNNQEELRKYAQNQTTLMREINHRVMNNLSVISSLLGLQIAKVEDGNIKSVLLDSKTRVEAMSMIHNTLCRSDTPASIELGKYINDLGNQIVEGYKLNEKVDLTVDSEAIDVSSKTASTLGLVINEIITNALKYAFPDDQIGEIVVMTRLNENQVELTVGDNGVGISQDFDWKTNNSLGMKLIRSLVENQLNGTIEIDTDGGTIFTIRIPLDEISD